MSQHVSRAAIAFRVLLVTLRLARRLLRFLLRPPIIDVLIVMLVLYLLATLIGGFTAQQQPVYPKLPSVLDGR